VAELAPRKFNSHASGCASNSCEIHGNLSLCRAACPIFTRDFHPTLFRLPPRSIFGGTAALSDTRPIISARSSAPIRDLQIAVQLSPDTLSRQSSLASVVLASARQHSDGWLPSARYFHTPHPPPPTPPLAEATGMRAAPAFSSRPAREWRNRDYYVPLRNATLPRRASRSG